MCALPDLHLSYGKSKDTLITFVFLGLVKQNVIRHIYSAVPNQTDKTLMNEIGLQHGSLFLS